MAMLWMILLLLGKKSIPKVSGACAPADPGDVGQRITGGIASERGRYPFMTSVQNSGSHTCGAVLIGEDLVLTAAHCVDGASSSRGSFPKLFVGGLWSSGDPQAESHTACRTIIHDKYEAGNVAKGYDIALIELSKKSSKGAVKMGAISPGQTVRAMGWGVDGEDGPQKFLQEADLEAIENSECSQKLRDGARCPTESGEGSCAVQDVLDSMVCAEMAGADTCQGDSGGPLLIAGKGCGENDIIVGVTSFGFKCTDPLTALKFPSSYTRVSSFASWIEARGAGESVVLNNPDCEGASPGPIATPESAETSKAKEEEEEEEEEEERKLDPPSGSVKPPKPSTEEPKSDPAPAPATAVPDGCMFLNGVWVPPGCDGRRR